MDVSTPKQGKRRRRRHHAAESGARSSLLAQAPSHGAALAEHLARHAPAADLPEIESAARQTLETIAFLAVCQGRGLLETGSLERAARRGQVGRRLGEVVARLDERFGPGLFAAASPPQDTASPALPWPGVEMDDERLRRCVRALATADDMASAQCPADVLGRIHESLLGMRLVRGCAGDVQVQQSPAARKAAGVFYTPECVARYIVEHTVGRLLKAGGGEAELRGQGVPKLELGNKSLGFTILDPACGCGSLLLAACRRLLDQDRRAGRQARPPVARQLFGVDVDPEAVLVARRSLWLEIVTAGGGELDDAAARRVLDHLTANVRCGDALPGAELRGLEGRVDAVIGNPPYRRELDTKHLLDRVAATEFGRRWRTARMDFWYYFLHRGLELLRPGGLLSFIVGAYWTAGRGAEKLIRALRESAHVEEIFDLDDLPVFPGVSGRHMILHVRKRLACGGSGADDTGATTIRRVAGIGSPLPSAGEGSGVRASSLAAADRTHGEPPGLSRRRGMRGDKPRGSPVPSAALGHKPDLEHVLSGRAPLVEYHKTVGQLFLAGRVDLEPPADELLARLDRFTPLGGLGKVRQGIAENPASVTAKLNARWGNRWRTGEGVFALTPGELAALDLPEHEKRLVRPYHDLCDLGRYHLADEPSLVLIYSTRETCPDIGAFPRLRAHLERFRPALLARRETRRGTRRWWHLHWPRDEALWRSPKVIALQMSRRPALAVAERPVYVPFSVNVFVPDPATREHPGYFAAVLNSRLLWDWFRHHAKRRGVGLEINGGVLARAPIRRIDFHDPADRRRHDRLVALVRQMTPAKTGDGEIDELVEELYGLSPAAGGA